MACFSFMVGHCEYDIFVAQIIFYARNTIYFNLVLEYKIFTSSVHIKNTSYL
jgi:hypothetical protein